jgi:cytochrome c peroxidase
MPKAPELLLVRFPLPSPLPPRYLRTLAYDPGGYDDQSPPGGPPRGEASDLLLGDLLYHAPSTLGARARSLGISCQSCHPNGAANPAFFLEGVSDRRGRVDLSTDFFRAGAGDAIANPVDIPSLRGGRFTGPYGHDGRIASLSEFVQAVVTGEFGGEPLPPRKLGALVRYVQDLDFLPNANLDERSHLTRRASDAARRGEAIFVRPTPAFGGGSCATCHDPSTFFRDGRVHRLGASDSAVPNALDDGEETPTLLGTRETAPYFHDGRFATLRDVVQWFDAAYRLGLTANERDDLTTYLEAVGATDANVDTRALARRLNEIFAYAALATDSDLAVRRAALEAVLVALEGTPPPSLLPRVSAMRTRLGALPIEDGPIAREAVRPLRRDLARLAADWAGATQPTGER